MKCSRLALESEADTCDCMQKALIKIPQFKHFNHFRFLLYFFSFIVFFITAGLSTRPLPFSFPFHIELRHAFWILDIPLAQVSSYFLLAIFSLLFCLALYLLILISKIDFPHFLIFSHMLFHKRLKQSKLCVCR
jgi:hypothetical protein